MLIDNEVFMVLLTFVWKCFQDRNFHGIVVGLYKHSIESWVRIYIQIKFLGLDWHDKMYELYRQKTAVASHSYTVSCPNLQFFLFLSYRPLHSFSNFTLFFLLTKNASKAPVDKKKLIVSVFW